VFSILSGKSKNEKYVRERTKNITSSFYGNIFQHFVKKLCLIKIFKAKSNEPANTIPQIDLQSEKKSFLSKGRSLCELKWKTWQKFISAQQFFRTMSLILSSYF